MSKKTSIGADYYVSFNNNKNRLKYKNDSGGRIKIELGNSPVTLTITIQQKAAPYIWSYHQIFPASDISDNINFIKSTQWTKGNKK